MHKLFCLMTCLLGACFIQSCTPDYPKSEELNLSWEVISNTYADKPGVKSKFVLQNNSQFEFTDSNWALFYNQPPRSPKSSTGNTKIERLSGDWFKLSPTKGFYLKQGEKVEIEYESSYWLIKEVDAPVGPYIVFYDKNGNEKSVVAITNYTIKPFTRPEQMSRYKNDKEPNPTAEWQYEQNTKLSKLDKKDLLPIIPSPVNFSQKKGTVTFDEPISIFYEKGLENEANYLAEFCSKLFDTDLSPREATEPVPNSIFLGVSTTTSKKQSEEAYQLDIRKDKSIIIKGNSTAGVFYGIQSLIAMLPVDFFLGDLKSVVFHEVTIKDAPRFPYRGMHLDVCRNFQSKETVKKVIDILAFYKINHLLFYITEDEGWRIEIKDLPELTEVGSQRGHTTTEADKLHPSYGSGAFADGSNGSGFYTREDFIEILQYAKARHINVIPEIGFPGHSRAAIKSMEARYKKYMDLGDEEKANEYRLIDPQDSSKYSSAQGYSDNIVNIARKSTYRFYETVVDNIIEMYKDANVPLEYFHTGGDEVPDGAWSKSPMCAELIKKHPEYKYTKNLQAYGTRKIINMLERKKLKIGGWEEVALKKDKEGKYKLNTEFVGKDVYPYVWNNIGASADLSYQLANAGYPVIMCNVSNFYFDLAYNKDPREPGLYWGGFCNTRNAWQAAPYDVFKTTINGWLGAKVDVDKAYKDKQRLKSEARKNIVGVQAQIWAETITKGEDDLMYRILPKLIGFSETAWSSTRKWENIDDINKREACWDKDWNIFANTLAQKELPRLKTIFNGYNYRVPAPGGKIIDGKLFANSTYPGLIIRYTSDGSEPDVSSAKYNEPISVNGKIKIKAFDAAGKGSLSMEVN